MPNNSEDQRKQGNLLLYNRAELKSSDHRPVMAIFELDVHQCDVKRRSSVFRRVIDILGPPDGAVRVELEDTATDFSDELIEELLCVFGEIGEIILVRFQGRSMILTYGSGQEALSAHTLDRSLVSNNQRIDRKSVV